MLAFAVPIYETRRLLDSINASMVCSNTARDPYNVCTMSENEQLLRKQDIFDTSTIQFT